MSEDSQEVETSLELTPENYCERLKKIVKTLPKNGSPINIIISQFDADALGAAMLLAHIIEQLGRASKIFICGSTGHNENDYILRRLQVSSRVRPIDELQLTSASHIALVDSNRLDDPRIPESIRTNMPIPFLIIDHHVCGDDTHESPTSCVWIDETAGSTCTMLVEIAQQLHTPFNSDSGEDIATIAALGIYQDTNHLVGAGERDAMAFVFLKEFYSEEDFLACSLIPVDMTYIRRLRFALESFEIKGSRLVTGIGEATENWADGAKISDLLYNIEGISLVVVWCIHGAIVRIFARCQNDTFDLHRFLKKRFDGGAKIAADKHGVGGAQIPFPIHGWLTDHTREQVYRVVHAHICSIVFRED